MAVVARNDMRTVLEISYRWNFKVNFLSLE